MSDERSSRTAIDPATLPREDPRLDERWPVTLDGVPPEEIDEIATLLDRAGIRFHVETVSPRVPSMVWMGETGLYDVLVRREDLRRAVDVLKPAFPERFPGEKLPDDSLWDMDRFGPEPVVVCRLSWHDSWDLEAALQRAGIKAIVLPDDVPSGHTPRATESLHHALADEAREAVRAFEEGADLGGEAHSVPVEDRWYVVVVLQPDIDRAAELAAKALGDRFTLDGSAYDG